MPRSSAEEQTRTRQALLEAAIDEIEERPLHEVTLEDVAKRAGYTKGAIYSNFSSRNELLISVLEYRRDWATMTYTPIIEQEPLDSMLDNVGIHFSERGRGALAHLRIATAIRSAALDDPVLAKRLVEHETVARDQLVGALETLAQRFGVEIPVDVQNLSTTILSISTMLNTRAGYNPEIDSAEIFSEAIQLLLEGTLGMAARKADEEGAATATPTD